MNACQILRRMSSSYAVGFPGCPYDGIVFFLRRIDRRNTVPEISERWPDIERTAKKQHIRKDSGLLLFNSKPQQASHGMPNKYQMITLAAEFHCRFPDGIQPLLFAAASESLHIFAMTGEENVLVYDVFLKTESQKPKLPGMPLDSMDKKDTRPV